MLAPRKDMSSIDARTNSFDVPKLRAAEGACVVICRPHVRAESSPCRPADWRANVAALAAEIARCEAAGEGRSKLWLDLVEWLHLEPQEGVPNPDWEMPPAMAEYLARLEKLTLLE